jgi:prevent-host-death family protein
MDIPAGQFKAHCLKLLDLVDEKRAEIIVTKRGRPVAKVVPVQADSPRRLLGYLEGSVTIVGDIVQPVGEPWEAAPDGH